MSDIRTVTIRQETEYVGEVDFAGFTESERTAIEMVTNSRYPNDALKLSTNDVKHQSVSKLLQKITTYPDDPIDFTLTEIFYEEPYHE